MCFFNDTPGYHWRLWPSILSFTSATITGREVQLDQPTMGDFWIRYSRYLRYPLNLTYPGPKYYLEEMDSLWLQGFRLHNKCNRIHTYIHPM